jgi:hypothetical protein
MLVGKALINVKVNVMTFIAHGPYSQHFIFFLTYKGAQKARVFAPGKAILVLHNTLPYWAHS